MVSHVLTSLFVFVTQKATPPPVESEAAAKGNSLSSSVEVMVDSAPVIQDRKVRMPLHHHLVKVSAVQQVLCNNTIGKEMLISGSSLR